MADTEHYVRDDVRGFLDMLEQMGGKGVEEVGAEEGRQHHDDGRFHQQGDRKDDATESRQHDLGILKSAHHRADGRQFSTHEKPTCRQWPPGSIDGRLIQCRLGQSAHASISLDAEELLGQRSAFVDVNVASVPRIGGECRGERLSGAESHGLPAPGIPNRRNQQGLP